ncbi:13346_t:CDS:2 [Ambispora gerdemannii]|uniref:13346_t:CDS:1 n=1 Tax=Ambispora gerdemannii TaxID=144530 RepID=A0A9N8V0J4_9GLOM|nr:13346_t:CDS:2 [Ambispora gerdemannii]
MASNKYQEINIYNEMQLVKEKRAKLISLIITGILIIGYGILNVWCMIKDVQLPVISSKSVDRAEIPAPGVIICGLTLDMPIGCYTSEDNAPDDDFLKSEPCDDYVTTERYDATNFVNMRGSYYLPGHYCYIFDPQKPQETTYETKPLTFNNSTQKIAFALYSSFNANSTLGAITNDQWFFFGLFTEHENPLNVNFQIVNIPSIAYIYFKRIEEKQTLENDAIIGGSMGNPAADVELVTSLTTSRISGFAATPNLWCILRIIPQSHKFDEATFTQIYPVEIWYKHIELPLHQLIANICGFILKLHVVPSPPVYTPYRYVNINTDKHGNAEQQSHAENGYNDPRIQRLRNELRTELQAKTRAEIQTIANDIEKYLSKHCLQDVVQKHE